MGCVELYHIKAAFLDRGSGCTVSLDDLIDYLLRHFKDLALGSNLMTGTVCFGIESLIPAHAGKPSVFTAV